MSTVGNTLPLKLAQAVAAATIPQRPASINLDSRRLVLVFWIKNTEVPSPISQTTNADAMGKATRMQGYVARLGLGMTLIKNQARDRRPKIGHSAFAHLDGVRFMISLPSGSGTLVTN